MEMPRFSLSQRFLVAPFLGLVIVLVLTTSFLLQSEKQNILIEHLTENELAELSLYTGLFTELSRYHLELYELFNSAGQSIDEGILYDRGVTVIDHILRVTQHMEEAAKNDTSDVSLLLRMLADYRTAAISSVENTTVSLSTAPRHLSRANENFSALHEHFAMKLDDTRRKIREKAIQQLHQTEENTTALGIFGISSAGTLLIFSFVSAGFLSKKIKQHIDKLHELSGETSNNNELGKDNLTEIERLAEVVSAFKYLLKTNKEQERKLIETNKELSSALTNLEFQQFAVDQHAIVSSADVKGTITYVNDRFCDISGYSREELIGQNHRIVKSDEHSPEFYQNLWRTIASGGVWHGEMKNSIKGGGNYWVSATIVPFLNKHGKPNQYISIRTDITAQKEMEATLSRQQDFLTALTETLGEGVFVTDTEGRGSFLNREGEQLLGWRRDEFKGLEIQSILEHIESDDSDTMIASILNGEGFRSDEEVLLRKDGHRFPASVVSQPMIVAGKHMGSVVAFQDITQRKQQQSELIEAKIIAEEASQSKSMFLANMSHEIRTPMNAIIGMSHLALQTDLSKRQRDYVKKIHGAGNALLGIINDILDFSKIEAGKLNIEHTPFTLSEVLDNVVTVVSPLAAKKNLEILINVAPDVSNGLVGDPLRLGQVITNLVSNAVKFTDNGDITISIMCEARDDARVKVKVAVTDCGIGMMPEQVKGLFKAFSQADGSTTRRYGGTGLGLTISKQLVEMMNGEFDVVSSPGQGSTFSFTAWFGVSEMQHDTCVISPAIQGLRFLVADGRLSSNQAVIQTLSPLPVDLVMAENDQETLRQIIFANERGQPFDLVLINHPLCGRPADQVVQDVVEQLDPEKSCKIMVAYQPDAPNIVPIEQLDNIDIVVEKPINPSKLIDAVISLFSEQEKLPRKQINVSQGRLRNMQVLLVEDNSINQQIAQELLEMQGAKVTITNNGKEAIATLEDKGPMAFDVVLMDLQMPVMDGHEATLIIRQKPQFDDLPIIAMTAHAMLEERKRCSEEGMNGHITKPVAPEALYSLLHNLYKAPEGDNSMIEALAAPAESVSEQLPQSPRLDVNAGLSHVAGNRTLYLKLLRQFVVDQADVLPKIRQAIDHSDHHTAERLAHTLHGLGGNLGAKEVSVCAALLEDALRNSVSNASIEAKLEDLSQQLEPLLADLKESMPTPENVVSTPLQVDNKMLKEHTQTLLTLCANGDGDAIDLFEKNNELFQHCLSDNDYDKLSDAFETFALDEAQHCLQTLANERGFAL